MNRVNEKLVESALGMPIRRADADRVRAITGFSIGGIPPVGHVTPLNTLIDQDLFKYEQIWAAAGTPFAVFSLTPQNLLTITGGTVIPVS
jgi:prolyl-tRNA editing enzyme YbaK/EbsC (Cys-tRNA(Pro) deacylase)